MRPVTGYLSAADNTTIKNATADKNGGVGIDLNGSSWSVVTGSTAEANEGGGFQLANDTGAINPGATASHDTIKFDTALDNIAGCGVIVVDHLGSTVPGALGVFDNRIAYNLLVDNGNFNGGFGGGAGVVLASPVPGGAVYDNFVVGNKIHGNGLAGVTVHSHVPGQNLSGNVITLNNIGTNNLLGDYADAFKTGVYIGSVSPLTVTVVGNTIAHDHFGIFAAGSVTLVRSGNDYKADKVSVGAVPAYAG